MIPILTCVKSGDAYTVWLTAFPSIDYGFENNMHYITDKEHLTGQVFIDESLESALKPKKSDSIRPKMTVRSIEVVSTPESEYKEIEKGSTEYTEKDLLRLIEHFTEKEEFEKCQYLKKLIK